MSLTLRTLCLLLTTGTSTSQPQCPTVTGSRPYTVEVNRFSGAGQSSTLPCDRLSRCGPPECLWYHYRPGSEGLPVQGDPRRSHNQDCSLSLHNVTDADAGLYLCRFKGQTYYDTNVRLSVLTVSQTVVSASQTRLRCVLRHHEGSCGAGRMEWTDQDGARLSEERYLCESEETVEQSLDVRTFTCSYEEREQRVSAEIRVQRSRGPLQETENETSGFPPVALYTASGAGLLLLLLLLTVAALRFFKTKSKNSQQQTEVIYDEPRPETHSVVDLENCVTYATIDHQKPAAQTPESLCSSASHQIPEEETVTYSALNIETKETRPDQVHV